MAPAARMSRATPTGLSVASAWNVTLYAPASAYGGAQRSGLSIIRWQSIGMSVRLEQRLDDRAARSSGWARSGCPSRRRAASRRRSTAAASSPSSAKSAARIDGAMSGPAMRAHPTLQGRGEHRIGSVPVWPQLHVRPVTEIVDRVEQRPGVQRRDRVAAQCVGDDADGLGQMRRTRRVQHHPAAGGSAGSPRPAARAAAWPASGHRRVGAATGPPACAAAHRARCTARRRAPGRSPVRARARGRRPAAPQREGRGCSARPGRRAWRRARPQ